MWFGRWKPHQVCGIRELCTWLQAVLILYSSLFGDSGSKCWLVRLTKNSGCVRARACMRMHACVCMFRCTNGWRSEVNRRSFLPSLSTFVLFTRGLSLKPELNHLSRLTDLQLPASTCLEGCVIDTCPPCPALTWLLESELIHSFYPPSYCSSQRSMFAVSLVLL